MRVREKMSGESTGAAVKSGFDKLARPYRWLEYLTFGPLLQRTRTCFLPVVDGARNALVVGDGDGRFTAALLLRNQHVRVLAVDASAAMLQELRSRVRAETDRLQTIQCDARLGIPFGQVDANVKFDLICTHFFLDCLHDAECRAFANGVRVRLQPGASWILSEFNVPAGIVHGPARVLVRVLYIAFGLLTGLRARRLPDYARAMREAGLEPAAQSTRLFGILRAELWRYP